MYCKCLICFYTGQLEKDNQCKHILWFPAFLTPAKLSLETMGTSSNKQTVHIHDLLNLAYYASFNNVNLQYITHTLYCMYHSVDMLIKIRCSHILFALLLHQIMSLQICTVKCFHIFHTVMDTVQSTVFPAGFAFGLHFPVYKTS